MLILRLAITNQLAGEEEAVIDILWLGVTAGLMIGIPVGFSIGRVWAKLQDIRYEREIERLGKAKA